jgi:hypothetical protein
MKAPLNFQETRIRSSKPARRFNFKPAIGLAFLCLGAGLLLPVLKSRDGNHHAMPPGQLQADLRTMVAGMRYLIESEPAMDNNPAIFTGRNATFTQRPLGRTLEMSDRSSNQTETQAGSSTNPPVPI